MKSKFLIIVLALGFFYSGVCVNAQVSPAVSEKEQERVDVSEITFAKSFNGQSLESIKKFKVESHYSMLKMQLSGRVNSGRITLTLTTPTGTTYKTIEIDATSDVTYAQELNLSKGKTDWIGDWQLHIKTEKADGSYRMYMYAR
jgi:hypothetical protein